MLVPNDVRIRELQKVQHLRYARFFRICGLRLVNIHVRQICCILRNRASLDLGLLQSRQIETFTNASIFHYIGFIPQRKRFFSPVVVQNVPIRFFFKKKLKNGA